MCNKSTNKIHSFSGKGLFPAKYAFTLLIPLRKFILSPKKLLKQLNPQKKSLILEVGPGPGFFSEYVAKAIPEGKLILFDIQESMLNIAKKRLSKKSINNVEYILSNGNKFPFPDNYFDIIFMVTVLGEVQNKDNYIKEFYRVLKKDGIIAISEQKGDPDLISVDELKNIFNKSNFSFTERYGNILFYTLIFKKKQQHY
jgi:ubiquinone/menaquinone biosynthesis C-methylase UbiE